MTQFIYNIYLFFHSICYDESRLSATNLKHIAYLHKISKQMSAFFPTFFYLIMRMLNIFNEKFQQALCKHAHTFCSPSSSSNNCCSKSELLRIVYSASVFPSRFIYSQFFLNFSSRKARHKFLKSQNYTPENMLSHFRLKAEKLTINAKFDMHEFLSTFS